MTVFGHCRIEVGSPMTEKQPAQKGAGFLEMEALLFREIKLMVGGFQSCGTKVVTLKITRQITFQNSTEGQTKAKLRDITDLNCCVQRASLLKF